MPATKQWKPINMKTELTLSGGLLRKPLALNTTVLVCNNVETHFVEIKKDESWLCEAATGKGRSARPLTRSSVIDDIRKALSAVADKPEACMNADSDNKMGDMAYEGEGEEPEIDPSPSKNEKKVAFEDIDGQVRTIKLPARWCSQNSSESEETHELMAVSWGKKLFIDSSSLSWLLQYLRDQVEAQNVPAVAGKDDIANGSCLYWDFRDQAWQARVLQPDGSYVRRQGAIKRRMSSDGDRCHGLSFEEARQVVKSEMELWVQENTPE